MRYVYKEGTKESQLIIEGMLTPVSDLIRVDGEWRDPLIAKQMLADKKKKEEEAKALSEFVNTHIAELGINTRALNSLLRKEIDTVGKLITYSREELSHIRNLGKNTLDNIEYNLSLFGLKLRDSEFEPEPPRKSVSYLEYHDDGTYTIEFMEVRE